LAQTDGDRALDLPRLEIDRDFGARGFLLEHRAMHGAECVVQEVPVERFAAGLSRLEWIQEHDQSAGGHEVVEKWTANWTEEGFAGSVPDREIGDVRRRTRSLP